MAIDKRVDDVTRALATVQDGATVLISGFGGAGFPNVLIRALREHGARALTLVVNSATHRFSYTHELIQAGLVDKVIASSGRGHDKSKLSAFEERLRDGRIEFECVPQGTMVERIRAGGAGIPAFYTPVAAGTALADGKETRELGGRTCVLEHAIHGDLALVRADVADRYGNLVFRHAQANFGPAMATCAACTVAEVRSAQATPIAPRDIELSGVFVNHVVAVGGPADA